MTERDQNRQLPDGNVITRGFDGAPSSTSSHHYYYQRLCSLYIYESRAYSDIHSIARRPQLSAFIELVLENQCPSCLVEPRS
jgi:hypothetical protein